MWLSYYCNVTTPDLALIQLNCDYLILTQVLYADDYWTITQLTRFFRLSNVCTMLAGMSWGASRCQVLHTLQSHKRLMCPIFIDRTHSCRLLLWSKLVVNENMISILKLIYEWWKRDLLRSCFLLEKSRQYYNHVTLYSDSSSFAGMIILHAQISFKFSNLNSISRHHNR